MGFNMIYVLKRALFLVVVILAGSISAALHISIQSPTAGIHYNIGDTLHFHWMSLDATVGIGCQIEISFDNGMHFYTIDNGTGHNPNDADWGNFDWVITDSLKTINSRMKPVMVYTHSDQVIIQIIDFYNKINDVQIYSSTVFTVPIENGSIRSRMINHFFISPNPTRGIIAIQGDMDRVSLFNLSGKLLWTSNYDHIVLNIPVLPAGAYVVKAEVGKESYYKKIILEK